MRKKRCYFFWATQKGNFNFFETRFYFCRYMIIKMYRNHMTVLKAQNRNLVLHTKQLYVNKKLILHKK